MVEVSVKGTRREDEMELLARGMVGRCWRLVVQLGHYDSGAYQNNKEHNWSLVAI